VYEFTRSVRAIQDFVIDELSNWYVRRSRRRFWSFELTEDKIEAYRTLHLVLSEICKLIAPFVPYLAEELYQSLSGAESVHLTDYPVSDASHIDKDLEERMQSVIDVVSLGRTARGECQIKIRQPLGKIYVPAKLRSALDSMAELVKEEVNIREILYVEEDSDFVQYELKPQFKVMGPKFGARMKAIAAALQKVNGAEALKAFADKGSFTFDLGWPAGRTAARRSAGGHSAARGLCLCLDKGYLCGSGYHSDGGIDPRGLCPRADQ
jgi:isoleucyl-tRNA synthetase